MRIIYGGRRYGKTTALIQAAAADESKYKLIVCHTQQEAHRVFRAAHDAKISIPHPISYDEFIARRFYGRAIDSFLIDNVDMLLSYMAGRVPIEAISITGSPENAAELAAPRLSEMIHDNIEALRDANAQVMWRAGKGNDSEATE